MDQIKPENDEYSMIRPGIELSATLKKSFIISPDAPLDADDEDTEQAIHRHSTSKILKSDNFVITNSRRKKPGLLSSTHLVGKKTFETTSEDRFDKNTKDTSQATQPISIKQENIEFTEECDLKEERIDILNNVQHEQTSHSKLIIKKEKHEIDADSAEETAVHIYNEVSTIIDIEVPKRKFPCPECSATLSSAGSLKRHMRRHPIQSQQQSNNSSLHEISVENEEMALDVIPDKNLESELMVVEVNGTAWKSDANGNKTPENKLQCPQCSALLATAATLKRHMYRHTIKTQHPCLLCSKKFSRLDTLKEHMRLHVNQQEMSESTLNKETLSNVEGPSGSITAPLSKLKCSICSTSVSSVSSLNRHMQIHNITGPHLCTHCNKSFSRMDNYRDHVKRHSGLLPISCDQCDRRFASNSEFRRHYLIHEGIKSFQCKLCDKSFLDTGRLQDHARIHESSRPYQCDRCEKGFIRNSDLKKHKKTHNNDKSYKCMECGKYFIDLSHLHAHITTHSQDRRYQCDQCDRSFAYLCYLRRHYRTHSGEKPFICELCEKGFGKLIHLQRHMHVHTGLKPYLCEFCNKSYTDSRGLKIHSCPVKKSLKEPSNDDCSNNSYESASSIDHADCPDVLHPQVQGDQLQI